MTKHNLWVSGPKNLRFNVKDLLLFFLGKCTDVIFHLACLWRGFETIVFVRTVLKERSGCVLFLFVTSRNK